MHPKATREPAPIVIPHLPCRSLARILPAIAASLLMLTACSGPDFQDGLKAYQSGDYGRAAKIWKHLAHGGNRLAERQLGNMYRAGLGVEQDPQKALHWQRKAAEAGDPQAYADVAFLYQSGALGPPQLRKAYQWYSLAADALPPGPKRREAVRNRDELSARLTPGEQKAAGRWLAKHRGD